LSGSGGGGGPCAEPQVQASQVLANNVTSSTADITWTNGNGTGRAVVVNTVNTFITPVNGTLPSANPIYAGGQQCVFTGAGNGPVTVSGLNPATQYFVRVYEYCEPDIIFNAQTAVNNPSGFTTTNSLLNIFPSAIQNLNYTQGFGPSGSQSYIISASNLIGSGNINVQASTNLEISSDNVSFSGSLALPFSGGLITGQPATLYVRLKAGLAAGQYAGETVSHSGGGVGPTLLTADGEVFSNSTSIEDATTQELLVYPNPSASGSIVAWNHPASEQVVLRIYGLDGRELASYEKSITAGNTSLELLRNGLPAGNYIIRISGTKTGYTVHAKIQWIN
jgi:stringent starvation protein B